MWQGSTAHHQLNTSLFGDWKQAGNNITHKCNIALAWDGSVFGFFAPEIGS